MFIKTYSYENQQKKPIPAQKQKGVINEFLGKPRLMERVYNSWQKKL